MWSIDNKTPFAVGQAFTQDDQTGDLVWMVAVKATFDISMQSFNLGIADEQEELHHSEEYRGEAFDSSLLHACDFSFAKNKIDILLDATAYAPNERPVTELMTGLILGPIKKVLMVYGNRIYDRFLGVLYHSPPSRFLQMPIIYEKAYGGWEPNEECKLTFCELRNPAGTGFFRRRSVAIDQLLPNIEYKAFPTRRRSKKNRIAGYGPIASHWSPRLEYAGTSENSQERELSFARPKDFNQAYYQVAPADQQLAEFNGGEHVVLYNLHPGVEEIQAILPRIDVGFETLIGNQTDWQPGKLQTILIKPDQMKLQMVWQASISNGGSFSDIKSTQVSHKIHKL